MEWIEIIDSIPKLISYLASGYIFVFTFQFISPNKTKKSEVGGLVLKSAIASTMITTVFGWMKATLPFMAQWNSLAVTCVMGALLGYVFASIAYTRLWNRILLCIGIKRTTYTSFWEEILDATPWLTLYMKDTSAGVLKYFGSARLYESNEQSPKIMLERYEIFDLRGEVIDKTDDGATDEQFVVVDISDCSRIHIEYVKKDSKKHSVCRTEIDNIKNPVRKTAIDKK